MTTDPDDWTRWKQGESIDVLAKERGCTRERMRHRLKRLDEGRTVLALTEALAARDAQIAALREALESLASNCNMDETDPHVVAAWVALAALDTRQEGDVT